MKLLLFGISLAFFIESPGELATLQVKIENVRNSEGYVLAALYNSEKGYPEDAEQALISDRIKAGSQNNTFTFKDIPSGTYAIAIFHDENDNQELDKNVVGIPQEGYGSSNNVQKMFRAPNFEESKFEVGKKDRIISIKLNY